MTEKTYSPTDNSPEARIARMKSRRAYMESDEGKAARLHRLEEEKESHFSQHIEKVMSNTKDNKNSEKKVPTKFNLLCKKITQFFSKED